METFPSDMGSSWGVDGLVAEQVSSLIRVAPEDFHATVEHALQRIGDRLNLDLAVLLECADDSTQVESEFHWVRPILPPVDPAGEIKALVALSQSVAASDRPMVLERIPEQLPFAQLTASALDDVQGTTLKSAIVVPVVVRQRIVTLAVGVVSEYRSWPERLTEGLRLLAEILSAASMHRRQELGLRERTAELARLSARSSYPLARLHRSDDAVADSAEPGGRSGESLQHVEPHGPLRVSPSDEIVGNSLALQAALSRLEEVAATDITVLLLGETGTGKELFAKVLHARSPRRMFSLVSVNCAALPPMLIESELFGHERGAFTGAVAQRQGRFELAHRGTLFLDEIGDLPLDLQSKLLRVLQEGEFERLGSSRTRKVDVRVVAATHRDLHEAVADGSFREDLFYRLNVFPVRLPPLRERLEDIEALVWYFVQKRQRAMHRKIERVPADVIDTLKKHFWPGNIRELENIVERALIHSTGDTLVLLDDDSEAVDLAAGELADATTLSSVERAHIEEVLRACGWRINGAGNAADRLGLHPNTLRFRMKKLGIVRAPKPSPRPPLTRLR